MATGQQFSDWSAAYRLFALQRFDIPTLMAPARRAVIDHLDSDQPLVAMMDDTLLHKRGRKIHGTSWRRDPLGPPFASNFIWGQRFLQVSAALPEGPGAAGARAIPIDLVHCPSPRKPHRNASAERWHQYRDELATSRISVTGAERIAALRQAMDLDGQQDRQLIMAVDGSYTNRTVIKQLPKRTTLIGRLRKDAKLYCPPAPRADGQRGRQRCYGEPLPTPEEIRQDPAIPWIKVKAFAANRLFDFEVKTVQTVRWRGIGARDMSLIIVRPLAYRPRKKARLLYRNPAYLLCSDPQMDLAQILQAYLWRWEIEVNFRDQKTLLGTGQAQVRKPGAVERVPALIATAYAFMLLSLKQTQRGHMLPPPRWNHRRPDQRCSSAQGINFMRSQLWGAAMGVENLTHFEATRTGEAKSSNYINDPTSAVFYAST
jgi:hypothetical protein